MDSFCQQERLGSYKALRFMRVVFRRYLQKYRKMHEFNLVDETSSYDLFRRTYRYAFRSSDHTNI